MTIHDLSKLLRRHLLAAAGALMVSAAMAQDPSACNHELCMHKGADRDARPLRGARKEGQLSLYTAFNTKDSGPITGAFERLTGVKVLLWRSSSEKALPHPRFADKLGIEASDTDGSAAVVKHMGEARGMAYFKKLAAARPQMPSGQTLVAELVSSGEGPIAATIYNHSIDRVIVKGAPVKRKALNPTFGRPNAIGVVLRSAHPHAALLFTDFMLSPQRQQFIKERNRGPPARRWTAP